MKLTCIFCKRKISSGCFRKGIGGKRNNFCWKCESIPLWYLNKKSPKKRIPNDEDRRRSKEYYNKNKEILYKKQREYVMGKFHGLRSVYLGMMARCKYKSFSKYKYYGGRGIKCLWNSFDEFKNDMYKSYVIHLKKYGKKDTTLDRIDVNSNYCKENCRWATRQEQLVNRRCFCPNCPMSVNYN